MTGSADPTARALADRLLDAQVRWLLDEVSGDRFAEVVARDVAAVLDVAATVPAGEVVGVEQLETTVATVVDKVGGSAVLADTVGVFADAIYDSIATNEDHTLGELVEREPVEALLQKIVDMHQTQERVLERLTDSPLVATVASKFVDKLVGDFVEVNRQRAEKIPGMGTLMSLGQSAADRARKAAESNTILGDIAGKGAMYALKRTNNAIREMLRDAPVHDATMEFWDLHADEPISGLREYLTKQDLNELVRLCYRIAVTTREKEYFGLLVDECVQVFHEKYRDHTMAAVLGELGLTGEDIATEILRYGPAVVEVAKRDGVLERLLRERLEPFYYSDEILKILTPTG
ncbi:hypothetical protein [Nocardia flavorosea]|uniref:Uncharacterized protein n=1 Tax=Nocardia flavorosea TaxID=53429 RepID=A0A846YM86_9NOCA|nr:hypothetical protein [Nocardia flavorosea]NKY58592.1 hypothetical protein [Nocardia flavorosea]